MMVLKDLNKSGGVFPYSLWRRCVNNMININNQHFAIANLYKKHRLMFVDSSYWVV